MTSSTATPLSDDRGETGHRRVPVTMDVAAFEPLVGCHGGLGGWQDRAFVMAPTHLFAMLVALGPRTELQRIPS